MVEDNTRRDFLAAKRGQSIRRPRTNAQRNQDDRITHICGELEHGRIQMFEFLEMASYLFEPDHSEVILRFLIL